MEKEFVTYEQALKLKELGFDEPCLSYYKNDTLSDFFEIVKNSEMRNVNNEVDDYISAPLKQQVFRWFRDKYVFYINMVNFNLFYFLVHLEKNIIENPKEMFISNHFNTHEEAEMACIDKLIELVKTQ